MVCLISISNVLPMVIRVDLKAAEKYTHQTLVNASAGYKGVYDLRSSHLKLSPKVSVRVGLDGLNSAREIDQANSQSILRSFIKEHKFKSRDLALEDRSDPTFGTPSLVSPSSRQELLFRMILSRSYANSNFIKSQNSILSSHRSGMQSVSRFFIGANDALLSTTDQSLKYTLISSETEVFLKLAPKLNLELGAEASFYDFTDDQRGTAFAAGLATESRSTANGQAVEVSPDFRLSYTNSRAINIDILGRLRVLANQDDDNFSTSDSIKGGLFLYVQDSNFMQSRSNSRVQGLSQLRVSKSVAAWKLRYIFGFNSNTGKLRYDVPMALNPSTFDFEADDQLTVNSLSSALSTTYDRGHWRASCGLAVVHSRNALASSDVSAEHLQPLPHGLLMYRFRDGWAVSVSARTSLNQPSLGEVSAASIAENVRYVNSGDAIANFSQYSSTYTASIFRRYSSSADSWNFNAALSLLPIQTSVRYVGELRDGLIQLRPVAGRLTKAYSGRLDVDRKFRRLHVQLNYRLFSSAFKAAELLQTTMQSSLSGSTQLTMKRWLVHVKADLTHGLLSTGVSAKSTELVSTSRLEHSWGQLTAALVVLLQTSAQEIDTPQPRSGTFSYQQVSSEWRYTPASLKLEFRLEANNLLNLHSNAVRRVVTDSVSSSVSADVWQPGNLQVGVRRFF